jgi:hypothetical protein
LFLHQNHGAGGGNGSIMVGMFVCLCLASQHPFEQEFFVPARSDLGVQAVKLFEVLIPIFERELLF